MVAAMADFALYRKYRPQNFDNLVGQDAIQRTLLNAIKGGHLSHAYLFCGPRGTGKTSTARLVAKAINCISPQPTGESCGTCDYCTLMGEGRLMDLIEIDAASNRGIDEIRDLREKIRFAPTQAPHKVYIIDEVHMLTTPAFNALLKTLEEPPSHAYFILATTEANKVPETILSRCQRFDFHRIEDEVMVDRLKFVAKQERIEAEEEALVLIARAAEGGMRNALSLFEQISSEGKLTRANVMSVLGLGDNEGVHRLLDFLEKREAQDALDLIQTLHREGQDLYQFTRAVLEGLREQLLAHVDKKDNVSKLLRRVELFQQAAQDTKKALIPQLPLEIAVLKSCLSPDEEPKAGWLSGILPAKKEVPAPTKATPEGLIAVPIETSTIEAAPQETPASAVPEKVAPAVTGEVTLETVKRHWPRILDAIVTPLVRQSFRTGLAQCLAEGTLTVEFPSKFHLDKVEVTVNKSQVEDALERALGRRFRLECKPAEVSKAVDATLEVFGGQLLD